MAKLWLLRVGCTSRAHTQYKMKASNRLGATIKRATTVIIMLATELINSGIKVIPEL